MCCCFASAATRRTVTASSAAYNLMPVAPDPLAAATTRTMSVSGVISWFHGALPGLKPSEAPTTRGSEKKAGPAISAR